jgi:hypothetical protein
MRVSIMLTAAASFLATSAAVATERLAPPAGAASSVVVAQAPGADKTKPAASDKSKAASEAGKSKAAPATEKKQTAPVRNRRVAIFVPDYERQRQERAKWYWLHRAHANRWLHFQYVNAGYPVRHAHRDIYYMYVPAAYCCGRH